MRTKFNFSRPIGEVAEAFKLCKNIDDLSQVLEIPKGVLIYIAYTRGVKSYYKTFTIPKKTGGTRTIDAPTSGLKIIQTKIRRILDELDLKIVCSHAYHKGRSFITNATKHRKKKYVFNIDLNDFFHSIHFGRVSGALHGRFKLPHEVCNLLAHLCCVDGKLPQGAPSSPALSNLVAYNLDKSLIKIAQKNKMTYTRYADDITFSCGLRSFPAPIGSFDDPQRKEGPSTPSASLETTINAEGFSINPKKTRLQFQRYRQTVTGVIVNEFCNIKRSRVLEIRRLIFLWRKFGLEQSEEFRFGKKEKGKYFLSVLYGHLAYMKAVRGNHDVNFRMFCVEISKITTKNPQWVTTAAEDFQVKDIFLSHASEDKEKIAKPIYDACVALGLNVFYDAQDIGWGDSVVEKINKGLGEAKIIVPVLTPSFLQKKWPVKELNAALGRFMQDKNRILPIVFNLENLDQYPLLTDLHYKKWEDNPDWFAGALKAQLGKI